MTFPKPSGATSRSRRTRSCGSATSPPGKLAVSTLVREKQDVNRFLPYLGQYKLKELRPEHFRKLYAELRKAKNLNNGKPLSEATVEGVHACLCGILLGVTLAAPAAGAALTAQQSSQKITVDGKSVQIEAYSINGNNYCKLRDIGKAVGFNVSYDAASNTVVIKTDEPYAEDAPAQTSRVVRLPTDGNQYVPQAGDRILCDDGTEYEIKDVVRWDTNVFAEGLLPPLPMPTCDWNAFPTLELPEPIVKHYHDEHGYDLFVRNVYEVRRMVYTIYNAIGEEPDAWRDGKPLCKIYTEIPLEYEPYTGAFWPWRASEITDAVHAIPNVRYYVDAYDYYHNHVYMYTRYLLMRI